MEEVIKICENCGRKMKRLARIEFYCKKCDQYLYDESLDVDRGYEYDIDDTNWNEAEEDSLDFNSVKKRKRSIFI